MAVDLAWIVSVYKLINGLIPSDYLLLPLQLRDSAGLHLRPTSLGILQVSPASPLNPGIRAYGYHCWANIFNCCQDYTCFRKKCQTIAGL